MTATSAFTPASLVRNASTFGRSPVLQYDELLTIIIVVPLTP